jgi:hypothetical protein
MKKLFFLCLVFVCGVLYAQEKIQFIFKYQNITIETKTNAAGKIIEKTTKDIGQSDVNLQIKELTELKLEEAGYIIGEGDISIIINPVILYMGAQFSYSITVEIIDANKNRISKNLVRGFNTGEKLTDDAAIKLSRFIVSELKK